MNKKLLVVMLGVLGILMIVLSGCNNKGIGAGQAITQPCVDKGYNKLNSFSASWSGLVTLTRTDLSANSCLKRLNDVSPITKIFINNGRLFYYSCEALYNGIPIIKRTDQSSKAVLYQLGYTNTNKVGYIDLNGKNICPTLSTGNLNYVGSSNVYVNGFTNINDVRKCVDEGISTKKFGTGYKVDSMYSCDLDLAAPPVTVAQTACVDSDTNGGVDVNTKGFASIVNKNSNAIINTTYDTCASTFGSNNFSVNGKWNVDQGCLSTGEVTQNYIECPTGKMCYDGVCVVSNVTLACSNMSNAINDVSCAKQIGGISGKPMNCGFYTGLNGPYTLTCNQVCTPGEAVTWCGDKGNYKNVCQTDGLGYNGIQPANGCPSGTTCDQNVGKCLVLVNQTNTTTVVNQTNITSLSCTPGATGKIKCEEEASSYGNGSSYFYAVKEYQTSNCVTYLGTSYPDKQSCGYNDASSCKEDVGCCGYEYLSTKCVGNVVVNESKNKCTGEITEFKKDCSSEVSYITGEKTQVCGEKTYNWGNFTGCVDSCTPDNKIVICNIYSLNSNNYVCDTTGLGYNWNSSAQGCPTGQTCKLFNQYNGICG